MERVRVRVSSFDGVEKVAVIPRETGNVAAFPDARIA